MRNIVILLRSNLPLVGAILFLFIWQGVAIIANSSILPGPSSTIRAAFSLLVEGYWQDLAATGGRAMAGWLMALVLGVPIGLVLGLSRILHDMSRGMVSFLRSLPAFMLITIPVAFGWSGEIARILTIMVASVLIIIDECAESLLTLPQDREEIIRSYNGGFWFILTRVYIFEVLGRSVVPVARTTVGISFIVAIVCESLITPHYGVGARLYTALTVLEMPKVYAFLLLTGLIGLILNEGIHYIARRVIFWK